MQFDCVTKRKQLLSRIADVQLKIQFSKHELKLLDDELVLLASDLDRLARLESFHREWGMLELIRMCNTPYRRYLQSIA